MNVVLVQILVTVLFSMPTFMVAVGNTWTSYSLPILESVDSPLGYRITKNGGNLLSSIIMLGSISSIGIAGYMNDKIGRKRTEILSGLCYVLAWSIITTAKSVTQLLIGRYMIGLGTGLHFVTGVVYVSEISHNSIRGTLLSIMVFMYNVGTLVSYTEGWFCSYDVINYLNLTVAVGFVLILLCMKETPIYLLRSGKEKEAIKSLKFYRGKSTVTQEILDEIVYMKSQMKSQSNDANFDKNDLETSQSGNEKEKLNQEKETANVRITEQKSVWSTLLCLLYGLAKIKGVNNNFLPGTNIIIAKKFSVVPYIWTSTLKSAQRALIILIVNISLSVCMGMIAVQAYAGQFFMQAAPSLSPHLCSVLLAVVVTIISGLSAIIVDLIPRRILMMVSCLLAASCMACLATMLRWVWAPEWSIPLVMVLYCIVCHLGSVNIPVIQIAECLPPQMNSFGTGVVMCSMFLANFAVLFLFKPAVDTLGLDGVFLLFAIIGLLTAVVAYLIMRETRKVPFEVVQNMFEQGYLYRRKKY